jgi:uncharacterized phage-associated protein
MTISFAYRKVTQALNGFAIAQGGKINKMKALKLLYFADRYHLRKYGRTISNDEYFAMGYGPVPSGAKDLAESSPFRAEVEKEYALQFIEQEDQNTFRSVAQSDKDVFSSSDREALNFAWNTFGSCDEFKLADITHRYPEWSKHKAALESKSTSRIKMNFNDFLEEPEQGCDPCWGLDEKDRSVRREQIQDLCEIHNLWN